MLDFLASGQIMNCTAPTNILSMTPLYTLLGYKVEIGSSQCCSRSRTLQRNRFSANEAMHFLEIPKCYLNVHMKP